MNEWKMVDIVETKTGKIEKTLGPKSPRTAERLEDGANRNLDHARYHTVMRDATPDEVKAAGLS